MGDSTVRPHHISTVAHHFFEAGSGAPAPKRGGASADGESVADYHFFVASPVPMHLPAMAAAGLARNSAGQTDGTGPPRPRVLLRDWHRQPWTARAFVDGREREHLRRLFRPPDPVSAVSDGVWGEGLEIGDASPVAGRVRINWINLGSCGNDSLCGLADLLGTARRVNDGPPVRADGLAWCVPLDEAVSETGAWLLGSLVEITGCRQVKVLLFAPTAVIGEERNVAGESPGVEAECRRLLESSLVDRALEIIDLSGVDGRGEEADAAWTRLAESMKMGAAAGRRPAGRTLEEMA